MMEQELHIRIERTLLRVAQILSWLFTPFSFPFIAFVVLFLFSYLRIMPLQYKLIVLTMIYCFTVLMPTVTIYLFRKINGIALKDLSERKKRYIPLLLTITSYVFCLIMMNRLNIPWYMSGIILASLIALIISVIVNLRWKLSEHMMGIGGVIGGIIAFSVLFGFNPLFWLCVFFLIGGLLGSARIILGHHTLGEVAVGFFLGFISSMLVLHPVSNLFLRFLLI